MGRKAWASVPLAVPSAVLVPALAGRVCLAFNLIIQTWWILPLLASMVSLIALALQSALGDRHGKGASSLGTPAYLISGPSLATLNLMSIFSLGPSPPPWVGSLMIILLCLSALVYYQNLRLSDEDN